MGTPLCLLLLLAPVLAAAQNSDLYRCRVEAKRYIPPQAYTIKNPYGDTVPLVEPAKMYIVVRDHQYAEAHPVDAATYNSLRTGDSVTCRSPFVRREKEARNGHQ